MTVSDEDGAAAASAVVARFAPRRALAGEAPLASLGCGLVVGSWLSSSAVLASELATYRSTPSALFLLVGFAVAGMGLIGSSLIKGLRSGPAVEVVNGRLRAYTGSFSELPVASLSHARAFGRGWSSRVVVYDALGPRLTVRADLMAPDAETIAKAITRALKAAQAEV